MVPRGPGLVATSMRSETLAGINRGRLRGWVAIAAVLLAVLAILSWPNLLGFAAFLAAAAICVVICIWAQLTLPEVEKEPGAERDPITQNPD